MKLEVGGQKPEVGHRTSAFRLQASALASAPAPAFTPDPLERDHFFIQWPPGTENYNWAFETATNITGPWFPAATIENAEEATVWLNGANFIRLHGIPAINDPPAAP